MASPRQFWRPQRLPGEGWEVTVDNEVGIGSGWQQSRQTAMKDGRRSGWRKHNGTGAVVRFRAARRSEDPRGDENAHSIDEAASHVESQHTSEAAASAHSIVRALIESGLEF